MALKLPLSKDVLKGINQHLRELAEQRVELERQERCGVDCQMLKDTLKFQEERLTRIKAEYFPGVQ